MRTMDDIQPPVDFPSSALHASARERSNPSDLRRRTVRVFSALALTVQVACGGTPPVVSKPLPSPVVSAKADVLDPKVFEQATGERPTDAYRVGPGDSLLLAVYGHPELAISTYAGAGVAGGRAAGFVVDNDGTIQFPLIGSVHVAGKSMDELRDFLEKQLATYLREPRLTVQVTYNGSIRYYLLGQFSQPGLKYSDRPLRLMEALALGGSVVLEHASLRSAYIAREGRRLPIDFQRLLRQGDLKFNIPLRTGDVVVVPDNTGDEVFVFGGVVGERAGLGAVPFINGQLDILQALAQAGFGFRERSQGILSETHVIRSEGDRGTLFVVDVEKILDGEAASFHLIPGDVIFVPTTALTDWNNAMEQILPTLQVISGLLSPYIQLKLLTERNN
jgi:polysaccharide biosynthesis/export protein